MLAHEDPSVQAEEIKNYFEVLSADQHHQLRPNERLCASFYVEVGLLLANYVALSLQDVHVWTLGHEGSGLCKEICLNLLFEAQ